MKLRSQKVYTFEEMIPAKKKKLSAPEECIPTKMMKKFPTRDEFIASYLRQRFSLPDSMIYYITKNPKSSKCYQKMIQACKHFFLKNQILVIHCLYIDDDGWKICFGENNRVLTKRINITTEKLVSCKIWIQRRIYISSTKSADVASDLIPKIYQCDATTYQMEDQRLSFEQFSFYSKNVKSCSLNKPYLYSESNSEIPFETVIASLPSLLGVKYAFHPSSKNVSKDTVKKLLQIAHFKNIKFFQLGNLTQDFDIDAFYDYYKKNKHMDCLLVYNEMLSLEYAEKLDAIVDEILADKSRTAKPLGIWYTGQLRSKRNALFDLRKK